jgi:hypothetical protein
MSGIYINKSLHFENLLPTKGEVVSADWSTAGPSTFSHPADGWVDLITLKVYRAPPENMRGRLWPCMQKAYADARVPYWIGSGIINGDAPPPAAISSGVTDTYLLPVADLGVDALCRHTGAIQKWSSRPVVHCPGIIIKIDSTESWTTTTPIYVISPKTASTPRGTSVYTEGAMVVYVSENSPSGQAYGVLSYGITKGHQNAFESAGISGAVSGYYAGSVGLTAADSAMRQYDTTAAPHGTIGGAFHTALFGLFAPHHQYAFYFESSFLQYFVGSSVQVAQTADYNGDGDFSTTQYRVNVALPILREYHGAFGGQLKYDRIPHQLLFAIDVPEDLVFYKYGGSGSLSAPSVVANGIQVILYMFRNTIGTTTEYAKLQVCKKNKQSDEVSPGVRGTYWQPPEGTDSRFCVPCSDAGDVNVARYEHGKRHAGYPTTARSITADYEVGSGGLENVTITATRATLVTRHPGNFINHVIAGPVSVPLFDSYTDEYDVMHRIYGWHNTVPPLFNDNMHGELDVVIEIDVYYYGDPEYTDTWTSTHQFDPKFENSALNYWPHDIPRHLFPVYGCNAASSIETKYVKGELPQVPALASTVIFSGAHVFTCAWATGYLSRRYLKISVTSENGVVASTTNPTSTLNKIYCEVRPDCEQVHGYTFSRHQDSATSELFSINSAAKDIAQLYDAGDYDWTVTPYSVYKLPEPGSAMQIGIRYRAAIRDPNASTAEVFHYATATVTIPPLPS